MSREAFKISYSGYSGIVEVVKYSYSGYCEPNYCIEIEETNGYSSTDIDISKELYEAFVKEFKNG